MLRVLRQSRLARWAHSMTRLHQESRQKSWVTDARSTMLTKYMQRAELCQQGVPHPNHPTAAPYHACCHPQRWNHRMLLRRLPLRDTTLRKTLHTSRRRPHTSRDTMPAEGTVGGAQRARRCARVSAGNLQAVCPLQGQLVSMACMLRPDSNRKSGCLYCRAPVEKLNPNPTLNPPHTLIHTS